jgi:hypothetical protein
MKRKTPRRPLSAITADVIVALKSETKNIIRLGELLAEAKDQLDHGGWLNWLQNNFILSERTARNYLATFKLVKRLGISATVSDLKINVSALYLLVEWHRYFSPDDIKLLLDTAKTKWITRDNLWDLIGAERKARVETAKAEAEAKSEAAAEAGAETKQAKAEAETAAILDGPPPELPHRSELLSSQREAFIHSALEEGVRMLLSLATQPSEKLAGANVGADDLELVANFLFQIATAKRRRTAA